MEENLPLSQAINLIPYPTETHEFLRGVENSKRLFEKLTGENYYD